MFKTIWSIIAILLIVIATIISKAPPIVAVTTIGGVLFVLAVAFKKNIAPLLGAILSVLYGVLSYDSGFYANAALNMLHPMSPTPNLERS